MQRDMEEDRREFTAVRLMYIVTAVSRYGVSSGYDVLACELTSAGQWKAICGQKCMFIIFVCVVFLVVLCFLYISLFGLFVCLFVCCYLIVVFCLFWGEG